MASHSIQNTCIGTKSVYGVFSLAFSIHNYVEVVIIVFHIVYSTWWADTKTESRHIQEVRGVAALCSGR